MNISLAKILKGLSVALDLAQISSIEYLDVIEDISKINYSKHTFFHHSARTTYIALELAKVLNLDHNSIKKLYISSLLHDIGAGETFSKAHTSNTFIKSHCISGASIMESFPNLSGMDNLSTIILYHHENWDGSGCIGLQGNNIPIESQIIRLSDLVEVSFKENISPCEQQLTIINWITSNSEKLFSKELVDAFLCISSKDVFWFNIETLPYMSFILDTIAPNLNIFLTLKEFESIANIFASIIDNKSEFTASHSREIADLAFKVAKTFGYDDDTCLKIKIAGLLHDIGKLAIPSYILDKSGSLSKEEFSIIKSHVYYTKIILDRIEDIPDISEWASNHHEKLNGKGYPRSLDSNEISFESSIIGVCDIYQALTEDRPYRKGLSIDKAFAIIDSMKSDGFICEKAVQCLKDTLNYKS